MMQWLGGDEGYERLAVQVVSTDGLHGAPSAPIELREISIILNVPVADVAELKDPWMNPMPMPVLGGAGMLKLLSVIGGGDAFDPENWMLTVPSCEVHPVTEYATEIDVIVSPLTVKEIWRPCDVVPVHEPFIAPLPAIGGWPEPEPPPPSDALAAPPGAL
jgi:hypothetical protein